MTQGVVLLGKGTLAIRIADWFSRQPEYDLKLIVPVMPEPAWTDSLADWASSHGVPIVASGHFKISLAELPEGGRFFPKPYSGSAIAAAFREMAA